MKRDKFKLKTDRFQYPAGTTVVEFHGHDYGCCREDSEALKIEHTVVTADLEGKGPFFTCPITELEPIDGAILPIARYVVLVLLMALIIGCGGGTHPAPQLTASAPVVTPPATTPPPTPPAPPVTQPTPPVVTPPPPANPPTTTTPPPVTTAPPTATPPPVTTAPPPAAPPTPQTITAWGNSQTQGFGIDGCEEFSCHPDGAWPQVMATAKGWQLDNQAVGATTCADLTTQGSTKSLWDLQIAEDSLNIYGMGHNEEVWLGSEVGIAQQCIEAQTAWLAIPETQKVRAANCIQSGGKWAAYAASSTAAMFSTIAGASLSCTVSGSTVYLSAAKVYAQTAATYSISIDGVPVSDTNKPTFDQSIDVNLGSPLASFLRVSGLTDTPHVITYTCIDPGSAWCVMFYVAGLQGSSAKVYSMSPVPNASWNTQSNFDPATYAVYVAAWKAMVTELQGDELNIIPVDVNNPQVYDPNTQSQGDGIHETSAGHASIGAYAATL